MKLSLTLEGTFFFQDQMKLLIIMLKSSCELDNRELTQLTRNVNKKDMKRQRPRNPEAKKLLHVRNYFIKKIQQQYLLYNSLIVLFSSSKSRHTWDGQILNFGGINDLISVKKKSQQIHEEAKHIS